MPSVKSNNTQKKSPGKRVKRTLPTVADDVWFPEKLAKVNALLDKAILLPPHNRKIKKNS